MPECVGTDTNWVAGRAPEEPDTILIGSGNRIWCRVVGVPGEPAEPKARLMIASPDLLAAVRQEADALRLDLEVLAFAGRPPAVKAVRMQVRLKALDALIARAAGEGVDRG